MPRKLALVSAVAFLCVGLVTSAGTAVAGAKPKPPVTFSGSTTCSINGKINYSPALQSTSTGTSTELVSGTLKNCNNAHQHGVTLTGGHLHGLKGSVTPSDCTTLANGPQPPLSGGTVIWTPPSKVDASHGVSMPAGVGSTVTSGGSQFLQFTYTAGSVASGSFANSGGVSMTVTSTQDTTQLTSACANGLSKIAFTGSITF